MSRAGFLFVVANVIAAVMPRTGHAAIFDAVSFMDGLTEPGATVEAGLEFSLRGGNTTIRRAGGAVGAAHRRADWAGMIWASGDYERAASETVSQGVLEHLRVRRFLPHDFAWEGFIQHEYDLLQRIRTRVLIGSGPRYARAVSRFSVAVGALPMYEFLRIDDDPTLADSGQQFQEARLSVYVRGDVALDDRVQFDLNSYWQPRFDDWTDARLSANAGLSVALNRWLTLAVRGSVAWDQTPAVAVETLDYRVSTGLEVSWSR